MSNKTYIIINETEVIDIHPFELGYKLPEKVKPSYIHMDKNKALSEITRLKKKFPKCRFVLYESISEYKEYDCNMTEII